MSLQNRLNVPRNNMQPVPDGYTIEMLSGPLARQVFEFSPIQPLTRSFRLLVISCTGDSSALFLCNYLYYLAFPKDRRYTKYLVYVVYIVEFVQTTFVTYDAFASFGYGFGNIEALTAMNFNWLVIPIMSAITACFGQVFYAYRIFMLSKSRIIPIFVTCVSLTSAVAAIITGIYDFQAGDLSKLGNKKISIGVGIWCGASALCDIIIAICTTYYLMHSKTGFRRSRILVTKIIHLTIETGSVTAVVALIALILFFGFPHHDFHGTPALIMPKLYANTIYMVLNSRIRILGGRETYMSSTDMSSTTTMIEDITSQSTESTRPMGRIHGRVSAVTIAKEVFNDDHEIGRMNDKP
ncbi:hypothetical protein F5146DRAFT_1176184 [Armillaria mellea]|nr:hypothetical protein F5146DRAFT_1176184 [Armillaria mellea]